MSDAQEQVVPVQEPVAALPPHEPVVSAPAEEAVTAVSPPEQPLAALPEKDSKKSKSRSLSRKRDSILNAIRGRKDGEEAKPAQEPEAAAAVPTADEAKAEEAPAPEKSTPKINKRNSIFGSIFGKKEPPTDDAEAATAEPAAAPEAEAAPVDAALPSQPQPVDVPAAVASKKEKSASPLKENFFTKLLSKREAKPAAEKEAPVEQETAVAEPVEETATTAAPTVPAEPTPLVTDLTTEAPVVASPVAEAEASPDAAAADSTPVSPSDAPKEKRRTSFFSGLGGKKEKAVASDSEGDAAAAAEARPKAHSKLSELFRNPSQAIRGRNKEKKEAVSAAAMTASNPAAESSTETEAVGATEAKATEEAAVTEPVAVAPTEEAVSPAAAGVIGDVVPEAVTVGSTPVVTATA
ncbi:MAG: hypothetical protein M1829_002669 [Trizodia sp. TS-e1964]|nr:MAG: hypothetical protein M1829_002669 [Trizodia sp. TS-e1964]